MDPDDRINITRSSRDWSEAGPRLKMRLAAVIFGFFSVMMISVGVAEYLEPKLLDTWFSLRGPRPIPKSVTLVRLDKGAYELAGKSSAGFFPRELIAKGIERIAVAKPKMLFIDFIFRREGDDPEANEALANSLSLIPTIIGRHTVYMADVSPSGERTIRKDIVKPLQIFADAAAMVVPLQLRLTGGVIREIRLSNKKNFISDVELPMFEPVKRYVSADVELPGDSDFINFYAGPASLTSISLGDLLDPERKDLEEYFRDRVVLIGAMAQVSNNIESAKDTFLISYGNTPMYGVEIHATIAANLLDGSYIRRLPLQVEVVLAVVLTSLITLLILPRGALGAVLTAIAAAAVWFTASYLAFRELYYFLPGLTVFGVVIPLVVAFRLVEIALKAKRERDAFRAPELEGDAA